MSTTRDTLLSVFQPVHGPDRPYYRTGVLLDRADFEEEQTYHRARLARSLAYLHGWGTVAGLRVVHELSGAEDDLHPDGTPERIKVEAGLAVDRIGRLLEVPRDLCLNLGDWFEHMLATNETLLRNALDGNATGELVADVFLHFAACERGKTPAFSGGPFDALDAVAPSRVRDAAEAKFVVRTEDAPPLPKDRWSEIEIADLKEEIYKSWRDSTEGWSGGMPNRLDHQPRELEDFTAVFLARVSLPIVVNAGDELVRSEDASVRVENDDRLFLYPTAANSAFVEFLMST